MSAVDLDSLPVLFQKANLQHLLNNQESIQRWEKYKSENEQVHKNLETFVEKLTVPVMVPVGNKAMFRGKLVHTNDVLMSVGDGYFIKGSVRHALEVINRRLKSSDEMLGKLGLEKKLIESRTFLPRNNEAFPREGQTDIFEECQEDEYEAWKEEHRQKVKESRQKLAQLRSQQPSTIQTEDDIFKHLDLLEMQEELEDEMAKLGISDEEDESSGDSVSESSSDDVDDDKCGEAVTDCAGRIVESNSQNCDEIMQTTILPSENDKSSDDFIRINFEHSKTKPDITLCEDIIKSPHDIYLKYSAALKKKAKNVKRVSFAEPNVTGVTDAAIDNSDLSTHVESSSVGEEAVPVLGEVLERTDTFQMKSVVSRPVSKFKSSRKK